MNNIVISTTLIAVSILLSFLYVAPEYKDLKAQRDSRTEYIESINTISAVQKKFTQAQDWRKAIRQGDLKKVGTIIPEDFNNVTFLLNLDTLASAHGISVGEVMIEKPEKEALYNIHNISFAFDAPYEGSAELFMSDLEDNLILFDVTKLTMENSSEGLITYSLSFNTYSQR